MALLDVKYVVIVEFINDVSLTDSVTFYVTEASYAAGLARSFELSKKISVVGKHPPHVGALVQCNVTRVVYAGT